MTMRGFINSINSPNDLHRTGKLVLSSYRILTSNRLVFLLFFFLINAGSVASGPSETMEYNPDITTYFINYCILYSSKQLHQIYHYSVFPHVFFFLVQHI